MTIVDRKSRLILIQKVDSKHAEGVTAATIALLKPYQDNVLTITGGKFSTLIDTQVYFAHPYSSWERGLNENTNGLIRQYFPKGSCFNDITDNQVKTVMHRLNNRPMKGLNYKTPNEVFFEKSMRKVA